MIISVSNHGLRLFKLFQGVLYTGDSAFSEMCSSMLHFVEISFRRHGVIQLQTLPIHVQTPFFKGLRKS